MGVSIKPTPISYFCGTSFLTPPPTPVTGSTTDDVESVGLAVVLVDTTVESFVSVAVDPEPHAVSVSATPRAKINVYFFIYSKYTKNK